MTTTDKSRADAMTDLSDDELALIREEAARITDDWCKRQFMEPSQKESDAKFVREVLRLAASPSSQPAAAPADLQGLRRSILTSREIVRDQDGMLSHPAVPYLDEDVNYETFFAAFGIEATFIHMEDDVDCDTYDRYFASNSPDCCTWTPSSPQGDGWMLLEIYDTEDGPVALYVREKKPESMRERWKREKRESDAAAPSPADERAAFDILAHLQRQREFSERTFGPGARTAGICDHIRKELKEIEANPSDLTEWIDVVILALDGAWRAGGSPQQIIDALVAKQAKNESRIWPDWRTVPSDKAIEHDRANDAAPGVAQPNRQGDKS